MQDNRHSGIQAKPRSVRTPGTQQHGRTCHTAHTNSHWSRSSASLTLREVRIPQLRPVHQHVRVLVVPDRRLAVRLLHQQRLRCIPRRAQEQAVRQKIRGVDTVVLRQRGGIRVQLEGFQEVAAEGTNGRGVECADGVEGDNSTVSEERPAGRIGACGAVTASPAVDRRSHLMLR